MHEEDDGWETIQDAQNAAATFALYSVRACLSIPFPCAFSSDVEQCKDLPRPLRSIQYNAGTVSQLR